MQPHSTHSSQSFKVKQHLYQTQCEISKQVHNPQLLMLNIAISQIKKKTASCTTTLIFSENNNGMEYAQCNPSEQQCLFSLRNKIKTLHDTYKSQAKSIDIK